MKLCIRNQGEIDLKALFLLGASTKDGQDKIGFFGSGNKYAMATLLRKGIPFSIYSGEKLIEITTQNAEFGGQTFQQIVIDGQPTSFTTRMGPAWDTWFAIREFYCNAVDEGEASWNMVESMKPEAGVTNIYIEAVPEIMEFWQHKNEYILDGTLQPIWAFEDGYAGETSIYEPIPGTKQRTAKVFRKGILVWESSKKAAFWYNFNDIQINESRVAQYDYEVYTAIADALAKASSKQYVERAVEAIHDYSFVEQNAYWNYLGDKNHFSEAWAEAVGAKAVIKQGQTSYLPGEDVASGFVLPDTAVARLELDFPALNYHHKIDKDFEERPMTEVQQKWLEDAKTELTTYGYWKTEFRVAFGEFKNDSIMGLCRPSEQLILISIKHMDFGYDEFCATLIEEMMHAEGYADGSRSFEQHLIKEVLYAKRAR